LTAHHFADVARQLMGRDIRKERNGFFLTKLRPLKNQDLKKPAIWRWGDSTRFQRLLHGSIVPMSAAAPNRPCTWLPAPSLIRASPAAALAGLSCISKAVWMTPSKAAWEAGHLQHREALCRAVEHKWCYERKQKANEDPIEHKW
jgi:hypothetical protein